MLRLSPLLCPTFNDITNVLDANPATIAWFRYRVVMMRSSWQILSLAIGRSLAGRWIGYRSGRVCAVPEVGLRSRAVNDTKRAEKKRRDMSHMGYFSVILLFFLFFPYD